MASYGFHSEAADEYLAATRYYLDYGSTLVAAAFVAEVEDAIKTLLASPQTWPVIEEPHIRRPLAQAISIFALLSLDERFSRPLTERTAHGGFAPLCCTYFRTACHKLTEAGPQTYLHYYAPSK